MSKRFVFFQRYGVEEYYIYDPATDELEGWRLTPVPGGAPRYVALQRDDRGWMWSEEVGLWLGPWHGSFQETVAVYPRFYYPDGRLVLRGEEEQRLRAEEVRRRLEAEHQRAYMCSFPDGRVSVELEWLDVHSMTRAVVGAYVAHLVPRERTKP